MGNENARLTRETPERKIYVKWFKPVVKGEMNKGRSQSVAVAGTKAYVFGGFNGTSETNDIAVFDASTMTWTKPTIEGTPPSPRSFHTACTVDRRIYIFGGHNGSAEGELNDMHELDTDTMTWKRIECNGVGPMGRYEHSASAVGRKIYIFGGGNSKGWLNDLHVFDTETYTWSQPDLRGKKPAKRLAHSASVIGNKIYIMGGYDPTQARLQDVHVLYTESMTWVQPKVLGKPPSRRAGHTAVAIGTRIFLYGGYDHGQYRLNDVHILSTAKMTCVQPNIYGQPPTPRSYHSACAIGRRMFIFGGYDGVTELNDIYYLEMDYVGQASDPIVIPASTLAMDCALMVNEQQFSDIVFVLDDGSLVYAHRIIIASRCSHFAAMLKGGMRESRESKIKIPNVSFNAFLALMHYIYTDDTILTEETAVDVLRIADQYNIDRLKLMCEKYIKDAITWDNVASCFQLADDFNADHLRKECLNYILVNFEQVGETQGYKDLSENLRNEVEEIISNHNLLQG